MRRIVISGCSGGGKSTLIAELAKRGHTTVAEPGRRVIAAERAEGGNGYPWAEIERFSGLAFWMAIADHAAAETDPTFYDRSALDQAAWYARVGRRPPGEMPRYAPEVFLVPPWREIYATDADRRHNFEVAVAEYADLTQRLPGWGYSIHVLPRAPVAERADRVLAILGKEQAA